MRFWFAIAIYGLTFLVGSDQSQACTTFSFSDHDDVVFGKSYDWDESQGMLVVNKRNVEKTALMVNPSVTPLTWVSKYGSVTFVQHGRDFPVGGMNEAGLMVEIMLGTMQPPPASDPRPAVNEIQWIQYALDSFGTVEDMLAQADETRIQKIVVSAHYLVCDRTSACAAVEYIDGELKMHTGDQLMAPVFANSTYTASTNYLRQHEGFGGTRPIPTSSRSLDRFVRAASWVKNFDAGTNSDLFSYAFDTLDSVAGSGVWRTVYQAGHSFAFKTKVQGRMRPLRRVNIENFNYECTSTVKIYDFAADDAGDITQKFSTYTRDANARIVNQSRHVPWFLRRTIINYPESSTRCLD